MICSRCGSKNVWTSRLRVSDIGRLLLFRSPVRCHTCLKRDSVGLAEARKMREAEIAAHDGSQNELQSPG